MPHESAQPLEPLTRSGHGYGRLGALRAIDRAGEVRDCDLGVQPGRDGSDDGQPRRSTPATAAEEA
jgi:hypothetical protein